MGGIHVVPLFTSRKVFSWIHSLMLSISKRVSLCVFRFLFISKILLWQFVFHIALLSGFFLPWVWQSFSQYVFFLPICSFALAVPEMFLPTVCVSSVCASKIAERGSHWKTEGCSPQKLALKYVRLTVLRKPLRWRSLFRLLPEDEPVTFLAFFLPKSPEHCCSLTIILQGTLG